MHPSSEPNFMDLLIKEKKLGATGEFPQGKIHETDEGEIRMAIAVEDKKVIIAFGKSTSWVGMDKYQAIHLGECLIEKAKEIL